MYLIAQTLLQIQTFLALVKRVYDINLNYLGVRSGRDVACNVRTESGGKKEEERIVDGESFLFALRSGQEIIPQITNATFLLLIIWALYQKLNS